MDQVQSLDGAAQEILKPETFEVRVTQPHDPGFLNRYVSQGKFDVKEFVASFSEKLIAQSKHDSGRALQAIRVSTTQLTR